MKIRKPKDGDYRTITKFLWRPRRFDGTWLWLETVTIRQVYLYHAMLKVGWSDIGVVDPNDHQNIIYRK